MQIDVNPPKVVLDRAWVELGGYRFFQDPAYGDAYKEATRHRPLRVVARIDDRILGYGQAVIFREGPAFAGSIAAHATIRHGPLLSADATGRDTFSLLEAFAQAARSDVAYLRVYPGLANLAADVFAQAGFRRTPWINFYLDLKAPEETLFARLSKARRYGVRKAHERGVQVVRAESWRDVETAYGLLRETHNRAQFPLEPPSFFRAVFDAFFPKRFQVFLAQLEGRALATTFIAVDGESAVNWYAGSALDEATRKSYPNDVVLWEAIRWARGESLARFDMGGGGEPGNLPGFVGFKRQFGGNEVDVGHYTHLPSGLKMKIAMAGFRVLRKVRRLER